MSACATLQRAPAAGSERESQRSLHHAWCSRGSDLPEARVHLVAAWIELGRHVDRIILRVVERVVRFPAEREVTFFAADEKSLRDGHVPIRHTGTAHAIFARIAGVVQARAREGGGIEPLIKRTAICRCVADDIHPLPVTAAGEVGAIGGAERNLLRL